MARIRLTNGPHAGQTIEVRGELIIGRADADVVLEDAQVSRRHAAVRLFGTDLQIEDLGSSNGTYVDGVRISAPVALIDGSRVRIGQIVIAIEHPVPTEAPDTGRTRISRPADATVLGEVPPALTEVDQARPEPVRREPVRPEPVRAARPPAVPATVGEFRPASRRRGSGLASRSWVPVALSFGTAVLTAVALVIYFAAR